MVSLAVLSLPISSPVTAALACQPSPITLVVTPRPCIDAAGATIDPTVLELVAHVDFRWQATQPRVPGQIGVLQRDIVARKVRIDLVTQWSHPTFGTEAAAGQVGAGDVACVECGTVGTAEIDHHPAAGVEGELAITAAELRMAMSSWRVSAMAAATCASRPAPLPGAPPGR
ncbi:hypothetical protein G6F40_015049 [Rhizopus arrhizus]|nr:hypothetical protein G6F40_015049 [Rhizopus arrhizus]